MHNKCPIKSVQSSYKFEDKTTDFVLVDYGSHIFFQVTQVGKVGRLVQATRDKPHHLEGRSTFSISNLLGTEDEQVDLVARQLVEKLNKVPPYKHLLLSYCCLDQLPIKAIHSIFDKLLASILASK